MENPAKGDLVQILDEAAVRIEPVLSARKFKFRREYAVPKAPVQYPDLMREVFVNLLHNSAKYDAHPEVVIDIVLERGGTAQAPRWVVRVGDRGSGIPDDLKPNVFDRGFSRQRVAAAGSAMAPKGSGIGLSICKFLVERSGGAIRVENRIPGDWKQGTNFIVELPVAQ
jgi:signal transduction histidine kinase